MQSPMSVIAERLGLTLAQLIAEAPVPPSEQGDKHVSVKESPEFRRVAGLPRRPPPGPDQPHVVALAKTLTEMLQRHENPYPVGRQYGGDGYLRPLQAAALQEAWQHGGLFGPLVAGFGKTLLAYLMPAILGSKRPLYIAPAALEKDVSREFAKFSQHWRGPHPSLFPFISYELLSSKNSGEKRDSKGELLRVDLLSRVAPDLIVLDECHKQKNHGAVCTKRMKRYLQNNPHCKVVAVSGTVTRRSLKDFAHILRWCLPNNCPLPTTYSDLEAWASALDDLDALGPRTEVGALLQLCSEEERKAISHAQGAWDAEEQTRSIVRGAVRRRMCETPGVVASADGPLGIPLEILEIGPSREDPAVEDVFVPFRERWELNGIPMADGLEMARHAKTCGNGYCQYYDPPPPDEWLERRKAWAGWCRDVVRFNRRGLDSEAQVKEAVRDGVLKDFGLLAAWEAIEPTYDHETHLQVDWFSSEAIDTAESWLKEHTGIIWVDSIPMGEELERRLGVTYYGASGMSSAGKFILDHKPGTSMVASKQANSTGRHLVGWSKGLLFCTLAEQGLARMHRPGQMADKVTYWQYIGCAEHLIAVEKELQRARYSEKVTGNSQRLLYSAKYLPTLDELETRDGARWKK